MCAQPVYHYTAFGLHIASAWKLPELPAADPQTHAACTGDGPGRSTVTIRRDDRPPAAVSDAGPHLQVTIGSDTIRLTWSTVGTFWVRGTSTITVAPYDGVLASTVRLPLLGVVLGVLLHRRGIFTLHASAVAIDGVGVAFVGGKGAGKSTLAAALQHRGHPLLTDDILALDTDAMKVAPAYPQLKLRSDAVDAIGLPDRLVEPLDPTLEKVAVRRRTQFDCASRRLGAVFALDTGPAVACRRETGRDAFLSLFSQVYALRFLGTEGATPDDFRHCDAVARSVPVFRLCRPRDLGRLSAAADCIEETVRRLAGTAPEHTAS